MLPGLVMRFIVARRLKALRRRSCIRPSLPCAIGMKRRRSKACGGTGWPTGFSLGILKRPLFGKKSFLNYSAQQDEAKGEESQI